jgi:hypothetical protein
LSKLCSAARALAVLMAIVAAFVTIPYIVPLLLILGAVSALTNTQDQNRTIFMITIVLLLGAKVLADVPTIGTYLSSIFGNLGTALVGASMLAIAIGAFRRVKSDWVPTATTQT